jgi:hypothetical protein
MAYQSVAFKRYFLILSLAASLLAANSARAEEYTKKLRSPATVKGFIGGESHDCYSIHARQGQMLTVQISWQPEHDKDMGANHAEFFVRDSPAFGGEGVKFGNESDSGRSWSGKIPRSGNYYVYVMGHPTAHYTLKVTTK